MSEQDNVQREPQIIPYEPEKWGDPSVMSILEHARREMRYTVMVCAVIKDGESDDPSVVFYTTEDCGGDDTCEGVVGLMVEQGELLESDSVELAMGDLDFEIIFDCAYEKQVIIKPGMDSPQLAINTACTTCGDEQQEEMEFVIALVGIRDESDPDGKRLAFVLNSRPEYGDGEGFREVVQHVYDEYGNGMFAKNEEVVVLRVRVSLDDLLEVIDTYDAILPVEDGGGEHAPAAV